MRRSSFNKELATKVLLRAYFYEIGCKIHSWKKYTLNANLLDKRPKVCGKKGLIETSK